MSGSNSGSSKVPGIVSPRFSNPGTKANPDGSMGHSAPGASTPVPQGSGSPGLSATKSIMNVSGTSGAVVSNTPEPGLKRVPTVTFSDSKPLSLKQQAVNNSATQQSKPTTGEEAEKVESLSPRLKASTSPPNVKDTSPPPLLASGDSASFQGRQNSNSSSGRPEPKKGNIISKLLHSADVLHNSPSHHSHSNDHSTAGEESPKATPVTSDTESRRDLKEDHPHFVVDDVLHSPNYRSRSNSASPMPTTTPNKASFALGEKRQDSTTRHQEPTILESPDEGPVETPVDPLSNFHQIAPNIPKRETGKNSEPRLPQDDGKLHVLFGATGSLSVLKIKAMIKKLEEIYGRDKISIQLILTQAAAQFFTNKAKKPTKVESRSISESGLPVSPGTFRTEPALSKLNATTPSTASHNHNVNATNHNGAGASLKIELPAHIQVWTDQDEWDVWKQRMDPVLHIELRRWADILVVAPLTANTLSKIALGLCDNLLTSVIRAWNPTFPIFLAPSMVSSSYNSTITKRHLKLIKEEMPWITVFKPSEKVMGIHGDIGLGGMMDANEIVDKVVMKLGGYPEDGDEDEDEDDEDDEYDESKSTHQMQEQSLDDEDEDEDDEDEDEDDDDEEDEEEERVAVTSSPNVTGFELGPQISA
ncbi:LADA_0A01794g1_1 [Lachancea dasiensis]|uniref:LADA_0A01794g1_1 n=1 Tax=Lachancea dasiensis TaxID=1072105 RepID=A0A1G4IMS9_9SACH|nr:LADA_0A01794g1_1 [Lachancea dasiensis]